ncbi:MAG: glycosyltransferase family 4 protein [Candidatus Hydrogenedentota bacterium]
MKVLHLFSNHKWTGPAEPAVNLCLALRARGIEAGFACSGDGPADNKVVAIARDRGIEPILAMYLRKHRHPVKNFADRRTLRTLLDAGGYDIVHCHLDNDHEIALGPCAKRGTPLVRSSYHGTGFPAKARFAHLLARTSRLIEPAERARNNDLKRFRFPAEHMHVVPGAVDTQRFDPAREVPDGRRWLNLPRDAFVLGIVARMQSHRRYEDLFTAFRRLADTHANAHLIVIGRGTDQERIAFEPVRRLGLEGRVHFTGYISGDNYTGMLKAFDAGVFLVPGSDGTCRAVREMMAMGKPMIAANRGMLAEIVAHEENGLITDGTVNALHTGFVRLADDRTWRASLGRAARHTAHTRYSLDAQAEAVLKVYQGLGR